MKQVTTYIYKITNVVNNKFYIGSTIYTKDRFYNHKRTLNLNKHINKHLQNSWNKYGEHNFKFEIIDSIFGTRNDGYDLEQFYLDKYYDNVECYNFSKCARTPLSNKRNDIIIAYNYKGEIEFEEELESMSVKMNIDRRYLLEKCRKKHKYHYKGFLFRFKGDSPEDEGRDNFKDYNRVVHLDFLGRFIEEFDTINDAQKLLYKSHGKIKNIINTKITMNDDSYFVYKFDYIPRKWFKCTREHVLNHILRDGKMNLKDNPFVAYQIFDLYGKNLINLNNITEISEYLDVKLDGVETNIRIQRKFNFQKQIPFHDKYIIYITSSEDLEESIIVDCNYYDLYKNNEFIIRTTSINKLKEIIQCGYSIIYDRIKKYYEFQIGEYKIKNHPE